MFRIVNAEPGGNMMNSIKKITILFLSMIFAAFLVVSFDSTSSIKAAKKEVANELEVTINENRCLEYNDNYSNYSYCNVFASLDNIKVSITKKNEESVIKRVKYRLSYNDGDQTYYSKLSKAVNLEDSTIIILSANDIIKDNEDANINFESLDVINIEITYLGSVILGGTYDTITYQAIYKPFTINDVSLYSEGGSSRYVYKVNNYNVYGESVNDKSQITISISKVLSSGITSAIRSPYKANLENYSYVILLTKFDGEFLIKVDIETVSGTISIERKVTCDYTAPTVKIEDATASIESDLIKITPTGVSNIRVFNLTISDGEVFYKVLSSSMTQPSISSLEAEWVKYTGRVKGAIGDIVIGDGLNGKYYLYVVARDNAQNYSNVIRSESFIIDSGSPTVNDINLSLDMINKEVIVSLNAEDVSSISSYMVRLGYYDDNHNEVYGEWTKKEKYSFRLSVEDIEVGREIFVEAYAIDGLGNFDETLITRSDSVKGEVSSILVSYENVSSDYLRKHGEMFSSPVYINISGSDIASIKVKGAEYISNPQICSKDELSYRCKFSIDGEYSLVVSNSDASEIVRRTFIINTHNGILVDSIKIDDYKKYFMASVVSEDNKFIVNVPNSVYDVSDDIRFVYVSSNGSYKHLLNEGEKVQFSFKDYDIPTSETMTFEIPLTVEQYTSLKYSTAFETNYILCYTIESEVEVPVVPETPEEPEQTPTLPDDNVGENIPSEDNTPSDENKENNSKDTSKKKLNISTNDMLKLFIVAAAIILFVKIINYRKNVKVI